ncbi:MAG: nucleotidyltransferase family protein, partial [Deltaproteobacteria bacterium]|nr:nucleotidyltransferase family protein [Deltaproteobacteria bacterium]
AIHLAQEVALTNARAALDEASIPYVVIKGAHLGRVLYDDPLQRVGVDVDVLVSPEDKARAIATLTDRGFQAKARAQTATHEINFTDGRAWIDLHWHLLRPGRTRRPVEDDILTTRQTIGGVSVPDDTWTTVIMLVHNAITDTVTARANRAVDLARWVSRRTLDWDEIAKRIAAMGLIAAAWATLTWVDDLLGLNLKQTTVSTLRPPLLQRAYLRAWLRADPSALYRDHPHLVRFGFGLALHDTPKDALRFALRFIATAPERRLAPTKR